MLLPGQSATAATAATFRASRTTYVLESSLVRRRAGIVASYGLPGARVYPRRPIHIPALLMPPLFFTGLVVALYTWKSVVMVSLQNKIIYAPYMPPTARHESISDWQSRLYGIEWKEIHMRSVDGTDLALAVASISAGPEDAPNHAVSHHVYILYLQGNAASIPPRLPDHSWILRKIKMSFVERHPNCGKVRFTQVDLSYRGYWTSSGRPSEIGINYDTRAAVEWISQLHENTYGRGRSGEHTARPIFILWGQSIGCGFATNLAAAGVLPPHLEPMALILETPFLSIKEMLGALYPEKWLPYKYLHPFLRNHLDSHRNLGTIAANRREKGLGPPQVFILQAGRDEIVPESHPEELRRRCSELAIPVDTRVVPRAYHSDAMIGRAHVADFIMQQTAKAIGTTPRQEL